jgi:hypothetical protein
MAISKISIFCYTYETASVAFIGFEVQLANGSLKKLFSFFQPKNERNKKMAGNENRFHLIRPSLLSILLNSSKLRTPSPSLSNLANTASIWSQC